MDLPGMKAVSLFLPQTHADKGGSRLRRDWREQTCSLT
jgi:hypothetical protein